MSTIPFKTTKLISDQFDFDHCKWYYDCDKNSLFISPHILDCIKRKILVTHQVVVRPHRVLKFMERGYTINDRLRVKNENDKLDALFTKNNDIPAVIKELKTLIKKKEDLDGITF